MTDLLLAAFPPELGPLFEAPPSGWVCACTGVGAVNAAATTAFLLEKHGPGRVVFLGSCGAYDERMPLGSFLSAREVIAASVEEVRGEAYRPGLEPTRWRSAVKLPFPDQDVVVTPAITRSVDGARELAALGPVEHLELSGVYAACHHAHIPCGAALVVVNAVGPEAHAQWKAHHAAGSANLIAALRASEFFAGA